MDIPAGLWKARHHAYSMTWANRKDKKQMDVVAKANKELGPEDNPSVCVGL